MAVPFSFCRLRLILCIMVGQERGSALGRSGRISVKQADRAGGEEDRCAEGRRV
jgi:hypothetical protein